MTVYSLPKRPGNGSGSPLGTESDRVASSGSAEPSLANHIHSVLRDVDNDFANDVLREHLMLYHVL